MEKLRDLLTRLRRLPKFVFVIIAAVLIVLAVLIALQVRSNAREAKWDRASEYFTKADYENANKQLKGLGVPDDPDRLRVYAQTKLATRDLDSALPAYQKLYDKTKDASYQLIVGNIYNEQKKFDDAAKVYQQVVTANPNNVQAYVNLATLYKQQNNLGLARSTANDAVKNNPTNATLLELRISMYMDDKNSSEYKDAVAALKSVNPDDPLLEALKAK